MPLYDADCLNLMCYYTSSGPSTALLCFQAAFEQVKDRLIRSVTKDSEKLCLGRLQYLDAQRIEKKILQKTYQHTSGYDEYLTDVEWVIKQYNKTVGLGPKVNLRKAFGLSRTHKQTHAFLLLLSLVFAIQMEQVLNCHTVLNV